MQSPQQAEWIEQYRGPNQESSSEARNAAGIRFNGRAVRTRTRTRIKAALRPWVDQIRRFMGRLTPQTPRVDLSDGYYESLGCHVLHFPTQPFILCALPTIYNPHDLQHLHYPQFWTAEELARRETVYRAACQFSNTVVVGSNWIKEDVVRQYALHPDKVQIIPWAPPTVQYRPIEPAQIDDARRKLALPETLCAVPGRHLAPQEPLRLFEALAELRDRRGLIVNLVCTGARFESHWPKIEQRLTALNLASQVKFLGFLPEVDLRAVYRSAQFLVLPTLFEADSCPVYEAWYEGVPVASSNHTAMPDQIGDAGLLFDAMNVTAIADALQRIDHGRPTAARPCEAWLPAGQGLRLDPHREGVSGGLSPRGGRPTE